ncbi:alpha-amylase [Filimonas effusa]|uniref:Alpha-amylase n=2 Tax=Filimonas effusa TaxID=2508721 RepID=A0A4Q1DCZ5_9BACT|nr:alpha-amylase [Filimonas effusa]
MNGISITIQRQVLTGLLLFSVTIGIAQSHDTIDRIEPVCWFTGMKMHAIQLIAHGKGLSAYTPAIDWKGVTVKAVHKVENPDYLFIDLDITPAAPAGVFPIVFSRKGKPDRKYSYELKQRNKGVKAQGVTSKDFIYLLMPDRFCNGDTSNDTIAGMFDNVVDRNMLSARHGGDLQGVMNRLDYLQDLGITALWMTPALENNEEATSYHGYANTESYHIDRRYGSNELFKALTDSLHARNMKMVMDVVPNHFGEKHWTVVDLPMKDWVHQWPVFTRSSFRDQVVPDPYAAAADRKRMTDGWFDSHMPDMNQSNPYVQRYIIQSHIWWIEYAGIDAFRIDTYPYNDLSFMSKWRKAILDEYPAFSCFGEAWVQSVANQAYFTGGSKLGQPVDTHLEGVTDFQFQYAIKDIMSGSTDSAGDINRLYNVLASDFLYKNPYANVLFLDNHDMSRYFSVINENVERYKAALAVLLTTRGIPQLYYGAEVLMKNLSNPDGLVREDFKGGWPGDQVNKFTAAGRTAHENEVFDYIRVLANYRKNNKVLQDGRLMQYIPGDGAYVYFRYDNAKTVMIALNNSSKEIKLDGERFSERIRGFSSAVNVVTGSRIKELKTFSLPANTTLVLELLQ